MQENGEVRMGKNIKFSLQWAHSTGVHLVPLVQPALQSIKKDSNQCWKALILCLMETLKVHHGVRIQDAALVGAATLSSRYIVDRFLPDKAIDLIDEAAAQLRMQIDSVPTEIDEVQRRVLRLEVEKQALKRERDAGSKERRGKIEEELSNLSEQLGAMRGRWENEKRGIAEIREVTAGIEKARVLPQSVPARN